MLPRQTAAALVVLALTFSIPFEAGAAKPTVEFSFHHEDVLGTSLQLIVCTPETAGAERTERIVLAEIERLRRILSTHDASSEISRLNAATGPVFCSAELCEVLAAYEQWNARSSSAYNGHLGELINVWRAAERAGLLPDKTALSSIVRKLAQPGWAIDSVRHSVTRLRSAPLNVDSLGKGYIIGKALAAARAQTPEVTGLLLNIGGDIQTWGLSDAPDGKWRIGVANPARPEDNAPPLSRVALANRAISTSAAYERGYNIAGKHYSHILDPRTGWPASAVASATVIALDNAMANALATILCVLQPEEGLRLVRATSGAECLLVAANGNEYRSGGFAALELPTNLQAGPAAVSLWPKGFQVRLDFTLSTPPGGKHPYVAIWIEDAEGKPVRTVTFWANKPKYYRDMRAWWKIGEKAPALVNAVTRATRTRGHHAVVWDGLDDAGKPLPSGTYTVNLEVAREHGGHDHTSAKINCGPQPAQAELADGREYAQAKVSYGPPPPVAPTAPTPP